MLGQLMLVDPYRQILHKEVCFALSELLAGLLTGASSGTVQGLVGQDQEGAITFGRGLSIHL